MDSKKRPSTAHTKGVANLLSQTAGSSFSKSTRQNTTGLHPSFSNDYALKEEQSSLKLAPRPRGNADLKTTATTMRATATTPKTESAHQLKQRVNAQFNNFLNKRDRHMLNDDDSLLQDSQRSYTRQEKQAILTQQKAKKKTELAKTQRLNAEKALKIKQSLKSLDARQKDEQARQARQAKRSKSREASRDRSLRRRTEELVERHRQDSSSGAAA